jgi:hypothetical protein
MSTQHDARPDERTPQGKRAEDATPDAAARDRAAASWAEHDMTLRPDSPTALHGQDAAVHGRSALREALGSPEALERAVRGRKTSATTTPPGAPPDAESPSPPTSTPASWPTPPAATATSPPWPAPPSMNT